MYNFFNGLTGGCGILVLLGMYGVSILCFLKALGGRCD